MNRTLSRTEIQGGPGGPWPPQKFSVVAAVNHYSFIILVFQNINQIGTPCTHVYLVQSLPFISLGSLLWHLQANKFVLHQKHDAINSTVAFWKIGLFALFGDLYIPTKIYL